MKYTLLIAILNCFIVHSLKAQFIGTVEYRNFYVSKTEGLSSTELKNLLGKKRVFYIDGSYYKAITYGEHESQELYRSEDNKVYYKESTIDSVYWVDASNKYVEIESYKICSSEKTVLGVKCDKLTIHTNLGTVIYYYSNRFPIDPAAFEKHHYGYWDLYTSLAKAVPLKIVYEFEDFTLTTVAIRINEEAIEPKNFDIPKGPLIKKKMLNEAVK